MKNRICEQDISDAVKSYLTDAGGSASILQIRRALPRYLTLSTSDLQPSLTRPREKLWEQQVRNIVCHRDTQGNPVKCGELVWTRGRLTLANSPQGELF